MCMEDCIACKIALCAQFCTGSLSLEAEKSNRRYLKIIKANDNQTEAVKKPRNPINKNLAYIFLVAGKEKDSGKAKKVLTDSRECYFKDNTLMPNLRVFGIEGRPVIGTIPAYLLVLDCSNLHYNMVLKC